MTAPSGNGSRQTPSLFRRKESTGQDAERTAEPLTKREEAFTEEQVAEAWKAFATERQSAGAGDAEKLVLGRKLTKGEGNAVTIQLTSELERTILEKFEQDLVQFMRKQLANDHIFLEKAITQQQETNKLYTSKDKYAYMIEQNPALKELKERLGLDFEY